MSDAVQCSGQVSTKFSRTVVYDVWSEMNIRYDSKRTHRFWQSLPLQPHRTPFAHQFHHGGSHVLLVEVLAFALD